MKRKIIKIILSIFSIILFSAQTTLALTENQLKKSTAVIVAVESIIKKNGENTRKPLVQKLKSIQARYASSSEVGAILSDVISKIDKETDTELGSIISSLESDTKIEAPRPQTANTPTPISASQRYDMGMAALENKNYQSAIEHFKISAESGFTLANVRLGIIYRDGLGVVKNPSDALAWFQKSADANDALGQYLVGSMQEYGFATPSYSIALIWYKKSAEQGNSLAQKALAWLYYLGQGVNENKKEALIWFLLAAKQNDHESQAMVGRIYMQGGPGVEQKQGEAVEWLTKAAQGGNAVAMFDLGVAYKNGSGTPKNLVTAYAWISIALSKKESLGESYTKLAQAVLANLEYEMTYDQITKAQEKASEMSEKITK